MSKGDAWRCYFRFPQMWMFKIGLYSIGISDTQTMYSGGTGPGRWRGPDLIKTKSWFSRDWAPWNAPKRASTDPCVGLPWQICLHNTGLVWDGSISELVNWDVGCISRGMPAAHISSLNLPPSRTVLMKGKHIRCSFLCFDSVPCRPGIQPGEPNLWAAAQAIFNGAYCLVVGLQV